MQLREKYIHDVMDLLEDAEIPVSECLDLTSVLLDRCEIENWIYLGLPDDTFSIQSGLILHFIKRWPLCIDTHGQANKWIRSLIKLNKGYTVRASDENCINLLQEAITTGSQILIENLQDHSYGGDSPFLDLLTHPFDIRVGFSINQEFVHFNPEFKLYMTTSIQNPYYYPQAYSKIALIDFTLGEKGLTEQLVTTVVEIERKEISLDRNSLIKTRSSCKRDLKEAEDAILELLSTESNIVDDQATVEKLKSCKAISKSAQLKEIESGKSQQEIDAARNLYVPLANYCTRLFMTISDLQNINVFYQYSVEWFIAKFVKSIKSTKHDEICHQNRISSLKEDFTSSIHRSIIISVLNKHKLLVSFLICASLLRYDKRLSDSDWDLFRENTLINWDPTSSISQRYSYTENEIKRLDQMEPFQGLLEHFQGNIETWESMRRTDEPSFEDIPSPFCESLTDFQKLVIFRALRPDKVVTILRKLINQTMGASYTDYQGLDLHDIYKDSTSETPILFQSATGSDAMSPILDLADKLGILDQVKIFSHGKCQEPKIEQAISDGQNEGQWVCIQNCDVASTQWLENFTVLLQVKKTNFNQNFRVFIISAPIEKVLPSSLTRSCLKITKEITNELKSSLLENYNTGLVGSNEFYNCCGKRQNVFAKLLFGISFFHAVVKAREKFDSLGWNMPYSFDEHDYSITIKNLQFLIQSTTTIPLDAIYYSIGYFTYGGKITDKWDKRILDTLVTKYINLDILSTMGYSLSGSEEQYVMPIGYSQIDYTTFIDDLPELTSPTVLGFHSYSAFVKNIKEGTSFFGAIQEIIFSKKLIQESEETHALDIIQHIQNKITLHGQLMECETGNDFFALFMKKELKCYHTLLNTIHSTLADLKKGCLGHQFLSNEQEVMIKELIGNTVPRAWLKVSYITMKSLPPYIGNLTERFQFLAELQHAKNTNRYWLPGFFNPRIFFAAMTIDYCKNKQIDIGELSFDYMVEEFDQQPLSEQFQIHGLYLESCSWSRQRHLIEEGNGFVIYEELPTLTISFIDHRRKLETGKYVCPIYCTALRERNHRPQLRPGQYIEQVCLDCEQPTEQWVLKGTALMTQIE